MALLIWVAIAIIALLLIAGVAYHYFNVPASTPSVRVGGVGGARASTMKLRPFAV